MALLALSIEPVDHVTSCVAVLVWLASIPRPRLYWSDPGEQDSVTRRSAPLGLYDLARP